GAGDGPGKPGEEQGGAGQADWRGGGGREGPDRAVGGRDRQEGGGAEEGPGRAAGGGQGPAGEHPAVAGTRRAHRPHPLRRPADRRPEPGALAAVSCSGRGPVPPALPGTWGGPLTR